MKIAAVIFYFASVSLLHGGLLYEGKALIEKNAGLFGCTLDWNRVKNSNGVPVVLPHKEKSGDVEVVYKMFTYDGGFVLHIGKNGESEPIQDYANSSWNVELIVFTGKGINVSPIEERLGSSAYTIAYINFSTVLAPGEVGTTGRTHSVGYFPNLNEKMKTIELPVGAVELFNRSYGTDGEMNNLTIFFLPQKGKQASGGKSGQGR